MDMDPLTLGVAPASAEGLKKTKLATSWVVD
jgi:hypothetical protein